MTGLATLRACYAADPAFRHFVHVGVLVDLVIIMLALVLVIGSRWLDRAR